MEYFKLYLINFEVKEEKIIFSDPTDEETFNFLIKKVLYVKNEF